MSWGELTLGKQGGTKDELDLQTVAIGPIYFVNKLLLEQRHTPSCTAARGSAFGYSSSVGTQTMALQAPNSYSPGPLQNNARPPGLSRYVTVLFIHKITP